MRVRLSDGYDLLYDVAGQGAPMVLLHDGILPARVWDPQVVAFAATHQVVRYDRRGYGHSVLPEKPYSNITDLRQLLDHLQINDAVLVGASNGGGVALDFTLAYPTRVRQLVLVGATMTGLSFSTQFQQRTQDLFVPLIVAHDMAGAIERWANDPYLVEGANPMARDRVRTLLQATPNSLINPQELIQAPPAPTATDLARLDQPALVITGAADFSDVHAHAGAIEFGLRNAQRMMVADAGHLVYVEHPEQFNQLVQTFVNGA